MNPLSKISELFSYHFMVNAYAAGTIVAVCAGAIGWFMVLRRQTFAGHTLAVIGFPGASAAVFLGLSVSTGYFVSCIGGAVIIGLLPRGTTGETRVAESAVIGTIQAFALAAGVLFVNLYQGFLNGVTSLLFGSFLGITNTQVVVLGAVCGLATVALAAIARPLLFASVDADVASARGVPVQSLSVAFLVLLGAAVAAASQITGSLLVFAVLVMPAAAAQRLTNNPRRSLVISIAIAVVITWLGLYAAYVSSYPVGFYLTSIGFVIYLLAIGSEYLRSHRPLRTSSIRAHR